MACLGHALLGAGLMLLVPAPQEALHTHTGMGTFTVGETTVVAGPGDIVIVPAAVPHHFVDSGAAPLFHSAGSLTGTHIDA